MKLPPIPLSFENGIVLEDSREILLWNCDRSEAWKVGNPTRYLPDGDTRIQWTETMLSGLPCGLLAYLPGSTLLSSVNIWLLDSGDEHGRSAFDRFVFLFDHLSQLIGAPIRNGRPTDQLPGQCRTWLFQGCHLQLFFGEKMDEFTVLEVSHGVNPRYPI